MEEIFNVVFYDPIYNLLVFFYHLLGDNLGLGIIATAIVARTVMAPLTLRQIKMARSGREFAEKMREIKRKHKNDKEKQQEELMKVQAEYLPAQLGGCLPLIFQLIFFVSMYRVISNIIDTEGTGFNEVAYGFVDKVEGGINGDFLGIFNLKESASGVLAEDGITSFLPYLLLIIGVGLAQFASTRILAAFRNANKKEDKKKKNKKKENEPEDFSEIMQRSTKQAFLIMPFLTMFIAFGLPSGLSVYWITQSSFVIVQQWVFIKLGKLTNDDEEDKNPKKGDIIDADDLTVDEKQKKEEKKKRQKKNKKRRKK